MWNTDRIVGLAGVILAAAAYALTRGVGPLGRIFVDYVLIALCGLSLMLFVKGFIRPEKMRLFESAVERDNVLVGIGILALYLFFMPRIGFLPSSFLFFFGFTLYLTDERRKARSWAAALAVSVVFVFGFYWVFKGFLGVPLPAGSWLQG